jgi:flagellar basal body-associated protein FliL
MNAAEIIVAIIVIILVGNAIYFIWRSKKKGKNACGYECNGCNKCSSPNVKLDTGEDKDEED